MKWLALALCFLFSPFVHAKQIVLFIGDSITAGYGVEQPKAYPSLVAEKLKSKGHDIEIMNASVSGSLTATATSRLKWALKAKPQIVVLALGANDAIKGTPASVIKQNLATCIELAKQNKIKVLLAGFQIFPNYGKEYADAFRALYPDLAKAYRVKLVPFLLEGVGGEIKMNQADGKHPNELGHAKIADTVTPYLEGLL